MTIANAKNQLRKEMISDRAQLPAAKSSWHATEICAIFVQLSTYHEANSILFYMSIRNEVDMKQAMEEAWKAGKRVLLPRVHKHRRSIEAVQIDRWDQLQTGAYGIREPDKMLKPVDAREIDLAIVPGVAFDPQGYRLGYGGGYYDRFFAQFPKLQRMGVAYPNQVVPTVYPESHDQQLHFLLTTKRLYTFEKRNGNS